VPCDTPTSGLPAVRYSVGPRQGRHQMTVTELSVSRQGQGQIQRQRQRQTAAAGPAPGPGQRPTAPVPDNRPDPRSTVADSFVFPNHHHCQGFIFQHCAFIIPKSVPVAADDLDPSFVGWSFRASVANRRTAIERRDRTRLHPVQQAISQHRGQTHAHNPAPSLGGRIGDPVVKEPSGL